MKSGSPGEGEGGGVPALFLRLSAVLIHPCHPPAQLSTPTHVRGTILFSPWGLLLLPSSKAPQPANKAQHRELQPNDGQGGQGDTWRGRHAEKGDSPDRQMARVQAEGLEPL